MADLNEETVRELNDSIRQLTDVMQSAMGITGSSSSNLRNLSKTTADAATATSSAAREYNSSSKTASGANKLLAEASYKVGATFGTLLKATIESKDALANFGKTMMDTREGMAKYSQAVNQAADAIGTGLSVFGTIGKVLSLVLRPLTILAEQIFLFQDNLFAAKDELAKFGAIGKLTTTEIKDLGAKAGYSTGEIEKFAKMVTKTGPGLITLGGSINQGVVEFAKLTSISDNERKRLLSLGVSFDGFIENTAEFVRLQGLSGRAITDQMRRDGTMQRATKEYTDNLLILASLTGESADEQKQKQADMAREHESQIANLNTSIKIRQLRESDNQADRVEADRLQKEMDLRAKAVSDIAIKFGPAMGKALNHFLSTGVYTQDTVKLMGNTKMSIEELREGFSLGKNEIDKFAEGLLESRLSTVSSQTLAVQLSKEYADLMGLSGKELEKLIVLMQATEKKSLSEIKKDIEDKIKSGKLSEDQAEQNRKASLDNEKKFRASIDTIAEQFQKLIPIVTNLGKEVTKIAEAISSFNFKDYMGDIKRNFDTFMDHLKMAGLGLAALFGAGAISKLFGTSGKGLDLGGIKGLAGKTSSALRLGGGAAIAGTALHGASALTEEDSWLSRLLSIGGDTAYGAAAGSLLGPKGAAVGAAVGTMHGAYKSIFGQSKKKEHFIEDEDDDTSMEDLQKYFNFGEKSGSKENFLKLNPKLKESLIAAAKEYNVETRKKITINSAARDEEDQKRLWASTGGTGITKDGGRVARPGTSLHEKGLAVDIQEYRDSVLDEILSKHGLVNHKNNQHYTMPGARLGGSFSGPNSGYPVMLHGMETVVPTPNPNTTLLKVEGDVAADKITSAISGMNSEALTSVMEQMYQMMENKLSEMVDKLSTSNDLQDRLLKVQM